MRPRPIEMVRQRCDLLHARVFDLAAGEHEQPRVLHASVGGQLLERPTMICDCLGDPLEDIDLPVHGGTLAQYIAPCKNFRRMILRRASPTIGGMDLKGVFARNIGALLDHHEMDGKALAAKARWPRGKKKGTKLSPRAVQYALSPDPDAPSTTLDLVEALAASLRLPSWALLYPGLDPASPPLVRSQKEIDAEVERRVAVLWDGIKAQMEVLRVHEDPARPSAADPFAGIPTPAGKAVGGKRSRQTAKKTPQSGKT